MTGLNGPDILDLMDLAEPLNRMLHDTLIDIMNHMDIPEAFEHRQCQTPPEVLSKLFEPLKNRVGG